MALYSLVMDLINMQINVWKSSQLIVSDLWGFRGFVFRGIYLELPFIHH